MAVPVVNIQIEQGADFEATFFVTNSSGSDLNLSNHNLEAKMRKSFESEGSIGLGVTFGSDATLGKIVVSLTNAQTGIITAGRYNYDVLITNTFNNKKSKVITGQAQVNGTVM